MASVCLRACLAHEKELVLIPVSIRWQRIALRMRFTKPRAAKLPSSCACGRVVTLRGSLRAGHLWFGLACAAFSKVSGVHAPACVWHLSVSMHHRLHRPYFFSFHRSKCMLWGRGIVLQHLRIGFEFPSLCGGG